MIIKQFEDQGLAHYSYAVGCEKKREIAIIDPRSDIEIYLHYAEDLGVSISHVLETHIHSDYFSGAQLLANKTQALLCISGYDRGEQYEIVFPHKACFHGDCFYVGTTLLKVLHTPGHTPEHLSFLLFDLQQSKENPIALFSGDFLFSHSVGRSDLLGEQSAYLLAKQLYQSIKKQLAPLPDEVKIYPSHGEGAFAGFGIGSKSVSTLEVERSHNPYLKSEWTEKEFISFHLSRLPPKLSYFSRLQSKNTALYSLQEESSMPLEVEAFINWMEKGAYVIDVRDQHSFASGHIPNSLCIGMGAKLGFWSACTIPSSCPIITLIDYPIYMQKIIPMLKRVGLGPVYGFLRGGFTAWKEAQQVIAKTEILSSLEARKILQSSEDAYIIDVRSIAEWKVGHIPMSYHLPCEHLTENLSSLPKGKLIFICTGGYRSILSASLLQHAGHRDVAHIAEGILGWRKNGGEFR